MVGKLRFAAACAEGIDERILGDDGFHDVLNRAPIARHSLQLPEGKRGKSGFDEMTSTLSVGRNVDRLETATRTLAQKTHGARGADCLGSAQAFTR